MIETDGYELIRDVFRESELEEYRIEANSLAKEEGQICVRHIRKKSKCFDDLAMSQRLKALLPLDSLSPVRSILFDKTGDSNWPVAWHQDLTINVKNQVEVADYGPWSQKDGVPHVQPPESLLERMVTVRVHLDDTPESNGALKVMPRSHLLGKVPSEKVRAFGEEVICECKPGDVLLMKPLLFHASARSRKPAKRRVIHYEFAPRDVLDPSLNWYE